MDICLLRVGDRQLGCLSPRLGIMLKGCNSVNCSIQTADTWGAQQQNLGLALHAHKYSRTNVRVALTTEKHLVYMAVDCYGKD